MRRREKAKKPKAIKGRTVSAGRMQETRRLIDEGGEEEEEEEEVDHLQRQQQQQQQRGGGGGDLLPEVVGTKSFRKVGFLP